jgi:predicted membrane protein
MAARAVSLVAATTAAVLLLVFPFVLGTRLAPHDHAALVVLMIGVSSAFVHGFGYEPQRQAWRVLFNPLTGWPAMLAGAAWLAL